jgi:hypothetical protein
VEFRFMGDAGTLTLQGGNSLPPDWVAVYPGNAGTVHVSGSTLVQQTNPGLASDYTLSPGSAAIGAARAFAPSYPSGVTAGNLALSAQFKAPVGVQARARTANLGAFE